MSYVWSIFKVDKSHPHQPERQWGGTVYVDRDKAVAKAELLKEDWASDYTMFEVRQLEVL